MKIVSRISATHRRIYQAYAFAVASGRLMPAAQADPPGDLDGFPATLVEGELGRRAGEGDTQRADVWAEATALISTMRSSGLG